MVVHWDIQGTGPNENVSELKTDGPKKETDLQTNEKGRIGEKEL